MVEQRDKPTVWVDLTDLAAWQGHFSGIQRVVYSYASRYAQGKDAKFYVYRRISGNFREVAFVDYFRSSDTPTNATNAQPSLKIRLKNNYRNAVPFAVRRRTTPLIRKILHFGFKTLALIFYPMPKKDPFIVGDKILLLGAPWESGKMINQLEDIKRKKHVKIIHLWHDMLPVSQPQLFDQKLVTRQKDYSRDALKISDGTISVSKATEQDLREFAESSNIKLSQHTVVREGEDSYKGVKPRRPDGLPQDLNKFIFSLGTLEVRKNHQLLYQAYKLAQQKNYEMPTLVIVGRLGWLAHDFLSVLKNDTSISGNIIYMKSLPDGEVLWLLKNSLFTIYPSLYEGWGLTIADSLGYGKLCLTGNLSSMPEVGGELADYFSPYDSAECLAKIREYYNSPEKLAAKEKTIKSYRPYSWDSSFKTVRQFVNSV